MKHYTHAEVYEPVDRTPNSGTFKNKNLEIKNEQENMHKFVLISNFHLKVLSGGGGISVHTN